MKVLLLENVPNVGRKYEIQEVKDGYGLNYLLPQGLARVASDAVVKEFSLRKKYHDEALQKREEELLGSLNTLDDTTLMMTAKANEQGHLFAGIDAKAITAQLKEEKGIELAPETLHLNNPIKEVGDHEIEVSLAGSSIHITVTVEAE